jgi:hypothetical protein
MSENCIGQCSIRNFTHSFILFLYLLFFNFFYAQNVSDRTRFNIDVLLFFFSLFSFVHHSFFLKGGGRTVKGAQRPIQGGSGRRAMHNLAQLQVL